MKEGSQVSVEATSKLHSGDYILSYSTCMYVVSPPRLQCMYLSLVHKCLYLTKTEKFKELRKKLHLRAIMLHF